MVYFVLKKLAGGVEPENCRRHHVESVEKKLTAVNRKTADEDESTPIN